MTVTGAGVQWTNNLALDGSVIAGPALPTVPTTPTNLTYGISGGSLTISWPANYAGWDLQSNSVSVSASSAWFTVPGSDATNQLFLNIDQTKTGVFYRPSYGPR